MWTTAAGYEPSEAPKERGRGRSRLYGRKIKLNQQWDRKGEFVSAKSPLYSEKNIVIEYMVMVLLWRPIGKKVKFIFVNHPTRGRMILMTTMLSMDPLDAIRFYGYRFKIETGFKSAIHTLGSYAYHFWMKQMTPLKRNSGDQYMHKRSEAYRERVKRKIEAYHRYIQLACIAQGLLLYLAIEFRHLVWRNFRSWMRTMKKDNTPSEHVTAEALRSTLPEFLLDNSQDHVLEKILRHKIDPRRVPCFKIPA